jgi:hypothetical protein
MSATLRRRHHKGNAEFGGHYNLISIANYAYFIKSSTLLLSHTYGMQPAIFKFRDIISPIQFKLQTPRLIKRPVQPGKKHETREAIHISNKKRTRSGTLGVTDYTRCLLERKSTQKGNKSKRRMEYCKVLAMPKQQTPGTQCNGNQNGQVQSLKPVIIVHGATMIVWWVWHMGWSN